jgi:oligopeptidase B
MTTMNTPVAKRLKTEVKLGKTKKTDPSDYMNPPVSYEDEYFWLRDETRKDPEVIQYLEAENEYTKSYMANTNKLQTDIYEEIKSRMKEDDESYRLPKWSWDSAYRYFGRTYTGKGYSAHFRANIETDTEELLLDVNELAKDKEYCDVTSIYITSDHQYMIYGVDLKGDEWYDFHFIDLKTGTEIVKNFDRIHFGRITLEKDTNNIYYEITDDAQRACEIWKYDWNTGEKLMLLKEDDIEYSVGVAISSDDRYLILHTGSTDNEEIHYQSLSDPEHGRVALITREDNIKIEDLEFHNDNIIMSSNKGHPSFYELFQTKIGDTIDNWESVECIHGLNGNERINISGFVVTPTKVVIQVRNVDINEIYIVNYGAGGYDPNWKKVDIMVGENEGVPITKLRNIGVYHSTNFLYQVTTSIIPNSLVLYDLTNDTSEVVKVEDVPNYNRELYESHRIYVPSTYGETVPVTIIKRKDVSYPAPVYQYGYGSYGHTIEPEFSPRMFSLIDRGIVYVIAHVRGSSMKGEKWYLDGKMFNKMNTFLDFINVSEYLYKNDMVTKLAAEGRSAGGLLMGSIYTMRPDLYDVIVAGVPFVDALGTMCDETIPLTTGEWTQWGNPNKAESYRYMNQYSPYNNMFDNIKYPNILILAGLNDPRVQYWEPAKFIAKLRHCADISDGQIYCLKTEMEKGHFGNTDRYHYIEEKAHDYAFVIKTLNVVDK